MDRISRALEQAKQGVANVGSRNEITGPSSIQKPVTYVKTRSVSLSPKLLKENRIFTRVDGGGEAVDTYGLLRTRILKKMRENKWKTIGITSPNPSVGKTTTAINLALSIALDHNYSTLLVDSDLRRPGISKALGVSVEAGLNDYLTGQKALEDVLINPQIEHIVIALANRVSAQSSELLSSPRMKHFINDARRRYPERLVIFDLPPVLVGDDVIALSQHLDALLLVVEDGKTQKKEMASALELLHDANILGVVLNKGKVDVNQYNYY